MSIQETQTLGDLLRQTIQTGAPLYNQGRADLCLKEYREAVEFALGQPSVQDTKYHKVLRKAKNSLGDDTKQNAWILRRAFDSILEYNINEQPVSLDYYWQDEKTKNTTVFQKAQSLVDTYKILRSTLSDSFEACVAVETLTHLGLSANRASATEKCDLLRQAGLIRSKSTDVFEDGTALFEFTDEESISIVVSIEQGSEERQVLEQAVDLIQDSTTEEEEGEVDAPAPKETSPHEKARMHKMMSRRGSAFTPAFAEASHLMDVWDHVEPLLKIEKRKYHLRTYKDCFVGKEAVQEMVLHDVAKNRTEAVRVLNQVLKIGLIHHVTRDHMFEDDHLFYRVTPAADIKIALDALVESDDTSEFTQLQRHALVLRYKGLGVVGLNISEILNSFFGCETQEGWDLVDLQNWRNNMKRWGFGRREDQDDEMVGKLSPILSNIEPDTWEPDEEWNSPYGILAQIAIFDQIPRSAFRGTPDAFKWDTLAIRASKLAIERGYFDSAFKSTLNQFLILLPLEHSESWDDQKLGVHLLLKLLSTIAILDEGLSDYEIVKRLEFSKRLSQDDLGGAHLVGLRSGAPVGQVTKPRGRQDSRQVACYPSQTSNQEIVYSSVMLLH